MGSLLNGDPQRRGRNEHAIDKAEPRAWHP
jgi:hypothetical protein